MPSGKMRDWVKLNSKKATALEFVNHEIYYGEKKLQIFKNMTNSHGIIPDKGVIEEIEKEVEKHRKDKYQLTYCGECEMLETYCRRACAKKRAL